MSERALDSLPNGLNDLGSIVAVNARRTPRRTAVEVVGGGSRNYADLDARSTRLANAIRGMGIEAGDRIAVWMSDAVEYVEVYVAAAKANVIVVPLNSRLTHHEAAYQIENTTPRALFYNESQEGVVEQLPGRDELDLVAAAPEGRQLRGRSFEDLIDSASTAALPPPPIGDPFMIGFTSGSTGRPKGAVLTHRSAIIMATTQLASLRIPLGGVNVQGVSMSFPATIVSHLMSHLLAGGTQVLVPGKWESDRLIEVVERVRGTHMLLPAPILNEFIQVTSADPRRWRTLVSVLHAGSRADPAVLERLADVVGTRYTEGWGMTEISGGVGAATGPTGATERPPRFFETVGTAVPGTVVDVVDEDRNLIPHDGETVGELVVFSPSLFAGYWNNPEATAAVVTDGWYFSGDLGSMDAEGNIYIADRGKNLIRSGGMNVYPAELELVLGRCPGMLECAVVGAPHPRWGETPVVVAVAQPGGELSEEAVIAYATEHLARYKKPTRVVFVDELPRTTGGKIVRADVRQTALALIDRGE